MQSFFENRNTKKFVTKTRESPFFFLYFFIPTVTIRTFSIDPYPNRPMPITSRSWVQIISSAAKFAWLARHRKSEILCNNGDLCYALDGGDLQQEC